MNSNVLQDSLKIVNKSIKANNIEPYEHINWWFWIAIAQFIIIIFLIFTLISKNNQSLKRKLKKELSDNTIDFDNIINSSFNSTNIYNELKVKCHPDRFPNDIKKNTIAEKLFQEITENKNNIKRLLELKKKAEQELNINF